MSAERRGCNVNLDPPERFRGSSLLSCKRPLAAHLLRGLPSSTSSVFLPIPALVRILVMLFLDMDWRRAVTPIFIALYHPCLTRALLRIPRSRDAVATITDQHMKLSVQVHPLIAAPLV